MTTLALPPDGLHFAKVPDRIAHHPGCTPNRLAVAWSIIRSAALRGYCGLTVAEIGCMAKLGRAATSAAISWLVEVGELAYEQDYDLRSCRRLVLVKERTGTDLSDKRASAHETTWGRAPGGMGARARRHGGARQESYPLYKEEIEEEKERVVPSRNSPESPASDPIPTAAPETGRDGCASLQGGGGGGEPASPLPPAEDAPARIAELEGELAAALAAIGGESALKQPRHVRPRFEVAILRKELDALRAPGSPAPRPSTLPTPQPLPRPAPAAPGPPRAAPGLPPGTSAIDETIRLLMAGPRSAGLFAASLAAVLGEPDNPATLRTLRDSAELLRPDWVAGRVRSALRPGVAKPANYLVQGLGKDLKLKRQTLQGAPR